MRYSRFPQIRNPPCMRNRSQFSYKTMNKTIGYCWKKLKKAVPEKVVSYSREPTVIINHWTKTFQIIIHLTKTFQMLIARESYNMRGDYMSYVWRMWGKRDIQLYAKLEAKYFHKAGSLSVSCKSCKICLWEEKLSLCQTSVVCLALMC